ncbi:unnamed protein product [Phaedon cochleariae]|uniref:Gustatory receptor n=1 Tax=Phaedon cochleariae TaxID=80249 RepID=A0A9N9X7X1_PHACE|nr:unnamed protein product [Phaedon cochleariae]
MAIQNIKVAPITKKTQANKNSLCFCQTVSPIFFFIKCFGILPVTTTHENNKCIFKRSWPWTIYCGIVFSLYMYQIIVNVDYENILTNKSLIVLLNQMTNAVYAHYVLIIVLAAYIKLPKYTTTMNKFAQVFKHGILCQSARRIVLTTQYCIISLFICLAASQAGLYYWLHQSETHHTNFSISDFFFRFSQTISLVFYSKFFGVVAVIIGGFACFEKLLISSLKYTPVHPLAGIDETNNERDFLGVIHYKLCRSEHHILAEFSTLTAAELVEYLRMYHEDLCLCIYAWNDCIDPMFLIHTVLELAILIIHWYAVVAHVVYNFKSPMASTIHILNCVFAIFHTYGLYLFLKNAQNIKNMIQGLTNFLLEYSTRISSLDEHQQVRLFIEKLKNHRPFTASGVFTIDLGIAGPISANILTYVLVALQFEIPKE